MSKLKARKRNSQLTWLRIPKYVWYNDVGAVVVGEGGGVRCAFS